MSILKKSESTNLKHGLSGSRFYYVWSNMRRRCYDPKASGFKYYGDRGIVVCERWNVFINFMDDLYQKYKDHAEKFGEQNTIIDRIDTDKNYCLENIRFVTKKQSLKNRTWKLFYSEMETTFEGRTLPLFEWEKVLGIPKDVLYKQAKEKKVHSGIFKDFMVGNLIFPQIWRGEKTRDEIIEMLQK